MVWARILKEAFYVEENVWENDGVLHPAPHLCSGKQGRVSEGDTTATVDCAHEIIEKDQINHNCVYFYSQKLLHETENLKVWF